MVYENMERMESCTRAIHYSVFGDESLQGSARLYSSLGRDREAARLHHSAPHLSRLVTFPKYWAKRFFVPAEI